MIGRKLMVDDIEDDLVGAANYYFCWGMIDMRNIRRVMMGVFPIKKEHTHFFIGAPQYIIADHEVSRFFLILRDEGDGHYFIISEDEILRVKEQTTNNWVTK